MTRHEPLDGPRGGRPGRGQAGLPDPVWRDRTNYIVKLDLTEHGMPGDFEQCWTRTEDQRLFELCCIPFFTYGQSLGDILKVELGTGRTRSHAWGDPPRPD